MLGVYFVNAEKIYLKDEYIYTDDDGRTKRTKERVRRMPPLLKKESLKPQHFKSTKKILLVSSKFVVCILSVCLVMSVKIFQQFQILGKVSSKQEEWVHTYTGCHIFLA